MKGDPLRKQQPRPDGGELTTLLYYKTKRVTLPAAGMGEYDPGILFHGEGPAPCPVDGDYDGIDPGVLGANPGNQPPGGKRQRRHGGHEGDGNEKFRHAEAMEH